MTRQIKMFSYILPLNPFISKSRNKLPHYVILAGPGCTHFVVFIHETHVSPSSGRVKTKKASVLILASCRSCVLHNVQHNVLEAGTTSNSAYFELVPVAPTFWHYIS